MKTFLVGLVLFLVVTTSADLTSDEFMFLEEIKPGMEGIGKTVVRGTEIRSFQIRVVDVIDNPGETNDFILIRASGDAIRESGGISAGMSGSPVYIEGRLIGAISAAAVFDVSPNPIAIVTPIEVMLKLIEPVEKKSKEEETVFLYANFKPVSTPVWVGGMGERAFRSLKEGVSEIRDGDRDREGILPLGAGDFLEELERGMEEKYNLILYKSGTAKGESNLDLLKPGGPIGVQLVSGDMSFTAIGTITYIKDDLLLTFGHPFLFKGEVEFFLAEAHILDTVESLQFPFKYGVAGERIGAVLEDRSQGIGAVIGMEPDHVFVNVTVRSPEFTKEATKRFTVEIVKDPGILPSMLFSVVLQAIDDTLNRIGRGTLKVNYEIKGPFLTVERQDIFYSFNDIALTAPLQISQVIFLLAWNEFVDPQIDTIEVDITVDSEIKTLMIRSVELDKEIYKPGDEINYTVTLKPFRGEEIKVKGKVKVPEDINRRRLTLVAFGGPREDEEEQPEYESFEELIAAIEEISSNDQLTVELSGIEDTAKTSDEQRFEGWVVIGEETAEVKIEIPEKEEIKEETPEPEKNEEEKDCKHLFYC
jgi:hypothetical protein